MVSLARMDRVEVVITGRIAKYLVHSHLGDALTLC